MPDLTEDPVFQRWLEHALLAFPAPGPDVADRLTGLARQDEGPMAMPPSESGRSSTNGSA